MMFRGLQGDLHTRAAMSGLLERGLRASSSSLFGSPEALGTPVSCSSLWVNSLVEWLAESNQQIWRHGSSVTPSLILDTLRDHSLPFPPDAPIRLAEVGLATTTDLLTHLGGSFVWDASVLMLFPFLRPLRDLPPPQAPPVLLPGQCWSTANGLFPRTEGYVLEYLGQVAD